MRLLVSLLTRRMADTVVAKLPLLLARQLAA
jgi:hypothetical protein